MAIGYSIAIPYRASPPPSLCLTQALRITGPWCCPPPANQACSGGARGVSPPAQKNLLTKAIYVRAARADATLFREVSR